MTIKRHIPHTNEAHDIRVAFHKLWDAVEAKETTTQTSVTRSGGGSSSVSLGGSPVSPGTAVTYTNAEPTPVSIGGIDAGTTFSAKTMKEMWDMLLYPYQAPAFSSFTITGQATTLEVGDTTDGSPSFAWTTTNSSNVEPNTINIVDTTAAYTYCTGEPNTSPFNSLGDGITEIVAGSHVFTISADNTEAASFSRTFTITWKWRYFYGESATTPLTEANIEGLRASALGTGFAGTYAFSADASKYKYLCYPASFGTASSFKDQSTNLDVPFETPYTISVTNAFGCTTNYNVHRSTNQIGAAINIIVS
jgi:hypothetical protein